MADKIKKYFQKKKVEAKFKLAGPGHRLTDDSSQPRQSTRSHPSENRGPPSAESRQAAAAAIARLDGQRRPDQAAFNTSLATIQAKVRRELEAEKKAKELQAQNSSAVPEEPKEYEVCSAVSGVFFRCPLIGNDILPKDEWNKKIREFLYEQLEEERALTACLIIQTCNKSREKIEMCIETLCKYLENIIMNPTEEKYRKIRLANRAFQDRVSPIEGAHDFLLGAGFIIERLAHQDNEEEFFVFPSENLDNLESLQVLYDALKTAEPIALDLDRDLRVLLPSQVAHNVQLPPSFYNISPEELKKEQQLRAEAREKSLMLRTKAMREKEEQRELRKYKYALIRIRFPDGIFLQGTFSVYEKLEAVKNFVIENIIDEEKEFVLVTATGQKLGEEDYVQSLLDLRLIPASILLFTSDLPMVSEEKGQPMYLKPEIMILMQSL